MAQDRKSRPIRQGRRTAYVVLLFVVTVLLVDAIVGEKGVLTLMRSRSQYHDLARSLAAARSDNARLREQARRLQEDPAAIEEIARKELGLLKPGETVFIVRDLPPAPAGR